MNRLIEIVAMSVGGLSLFLVCFVGFASLSGRDVSKVAVIGKLFPSPEATEHGKDGAEAASEADKSAPDEKAKGLSDSAVIEASLGILSAWTLPSPYSTSELRVLSEEIKKKHVELSELERSLARREHAVLEDEQELAEHMKTLEEMRQHLEAFQRELSERELVIARGESAAQAGQDARWAELAHVIGGLEDSDTAAKRLLEYEPAEAAKVLKALGDDERAGEILNGVPAPRWKEFVDAYTAEKARAPASRKK